MKKMKKLKTAVIGAGRIGWAFHLPSIQKHPEFELAALVEPLEERRNEAREKFGLTAFADTAALYEHLRPDLVVVASPTVFHEAQILEAFEHGCDVFSDKPLCPDLESADRLIAASSRYGRKMQVYQPRRLDEDCQTARELLQSGKLGKVYMIKRNLSSYSRRNDWQALIANGGGMLRNYGAHFFDQLHYLAGSAFADVFCRLDCIASLGDADDVVKAVARTENGIWLDLDISQATAHRQNSWQVLGSLGSALSPAPGGNSWSVHYLNPDELPELTLQSGMAAANRSYAGEPPLPWKEEEFVLPAYQPCDYYDKCYDYFALDRPPFVPLQETREVMRILDLCWQQNERFRNAAGTSGPAV